MPILPSRSGEIEDLVLRLRSPSPVDREVAIARLRLLGDAAVPALVREIERGTPDSTLAALSAAESSTDERIRRAAVAALAHADSRVVSRAAEVCGTLRSPRACEPLLALTASASGDVARVAAASLALLWQDGVTEALDAVLEVLFDTSRPIEARREALAAAERLPPPERAAIRSRLEGMRDEPLPAPEGRAAVANALDAFLRSAQPTERERHRMHLLRAPSAAADAAVAQLARGSSPEATPRVLALLTDLGSEAARAAREVLPSTEEAHVIGLLASLIERHASTEAVPALDAALRRLTRLPHARQDETIAEARARVHLALARAASRMGLYDLRDLLGARPVLAAESLLRAAADVGDVTLLPRLAALAHDEPSLEGTCRAAVTQIVRRDKVRRSARALRALRPAHVAVLDRLWPTARRRAKR